MHMREEEAGFCASMDAESVHLKRQVYAGMR